MLHIRPASVSILALHHTLGLVPCSSGVRPPSGCGCPCNLRDVVVGFLCIPLTSAVCLTTRALPVCSYLEHAGLMVPPPEPPKQATTTQSPAAAGPAGAQPGGTAGAAAAAGGGGGGGVQMVNGVVVDVAGLQSRLVGGVLAPSWLGMGWACR